jgi:MoaA/NifB/PqqE/SkfB family radical SAM enzyme
MNISRLLALGVQHGRNAIAEEVYLKTGYDTTKPVTFYGLVNERCNVKCRYCNYWRLDHYVKEMTIDEWKAGLTSIKDFVGKYSINFSGGEPFIKPGFIDLLDWCNHNDISAGVTTNGSALTQRNAKKVVAADPFNINISVDGPTAELHDYLRGYTGLFDKLSNGIRYLIEERDRAGKKFPIMIKPTVNSRNFRLLPEMVEWVKSIGATCLNLQPMYRLTAETYDELWIEEKDIPELERIVAVLLDMKQRGEPILNSETVLGLLPDHFREKKAPASVMPCRIGLRDFFIHPNGDVDICFYFPSVGNLREQSAREIWHGEKAQKVRRDTVACEKLCLITCLSQKTLKDKVKMGLQLRRRMQEPATLPSAVS